MKTIDQIRISYEDGNLDSIIPFNNLVVMSVENEIFNNKEQVSKSEYDLSEIKNLTSNDHSSYIEIETIDGIVTISRFTKEVPEEWYEVMSDMLIEEGIRHKVAATGTIYIKFNDDFDGEKKLRIGDHDANGYGFIDIDPDKVEDDFDSFVETLQNAQIADDFDEFIYED